MKQMKREFMMWPILWLCASPALVAQDLTLFENLRTEDMGPRQGAALESQVVGTTGTQFSLRSNSRFGDEYRSVLVDGSGNTVDIRWVPGTTVAVPGQSGYTVINVNAQELTLQQPVPCIAVEGTGVRCLDPNTAVLSLATLAPLKQNGNSLQADEAIVIGGDVMGPQQAVVMGPDGEQEFINPFAAAVMEQQGIDVEQAGRTERARARAERLQQFQVERIPDDQVPPGMRLVRTPFGDRLVPIRE